MKNKKQITLLVSVPVTITYNTKCGLDEEQILQEVRSEIKSTLMENADFFSGGDNTIEVNEFSVRVDDIMPTNYKYNA